jgi:hypothetical protein
VIDEIVAVTDEALRQVAEPRFLRTERGFQGRFYCALQKLLHENGLLPEGRILQMEYQKSARHNMHQRPDILLHVPAEESGAGVAENNFAVSYIGQFPKRLRTVAVWLDDKVETDWGLPEGHRSRANENA